MMGRQYGQRVVLREFRWEDLADIRAWVTDEKATQCLSGIFRKPHTWEQTEAYLRNMLEGGSGANFVVAKKEDLSYMGQANLMMPDTVARHAELAVVFQTRFADQGYGYEALSLLIAFGFEEMNLNRIELKCYADNARALHLYEKLGFVREGVLREDAYRGGRYIDTVMMGLLRREWAGNPFAAG